jgi:hypothetical protein
MTRRLESRIDHLENRLETITIINYRENEETLEQRKLRFRKEEGRELPENGNVIFICYRRIGIKNKAIPETR